MRVRKLSFVHDCVTRIVASYQMGCHASALGRFRACSIRQASGSPDTGRVQNQAFKATVHRFYYYTLIGCVPIAARAIAPKSPPYLYATIDESGKDWGRVSINSQPGPGSADCISMGGELWLPEKEPSVTQYDPFR